MHARSAHTLTQSLVHAGMRQLFVWAWAGCSPPLSMAAIAAAAGGRPPPPLPAGLDTPACAPWTQVHALNTLKQVFQDKELTSMTGGYVALGASRR